MKNPVGVSDALQRIQQWFDLIKKNPSLAKEKKEEIKKLRATYSILQKINHISREQGSSQQKVDIQKLYKESKRLEKLASNLKKLKKTLFKLQDMELDEVTFDSLQKAAANIGELANNVTKIADDIDNLVL